MDTFLFQQKFTVADGAAAAGPFRIIPCSISSISGRSGAQKAENDLAITPFEPDSAAARRVIETLEKNGKNLTYGAPAYPTQWP